MDVRMPRRNNYERTILYYPTIKIQDGYWLRNAILYWDNVASIVPGVNYDEFNSPEIEYLRDASIYKPIYPIALGDDRELCDQFCHEVEVKLRQERNRNRNRNNGFTAVHREKLAMKQSAMLHVNKTPHSILDFLKDNGIVMENCDGPWLNMRTSDAQIYMSILAKYLARIERHTDIGTDIYSTFLYPHARMNRRNGIDRQIYLDMALQDILPIPNMDGISLESIVNFRNEYRQELHCFRRRIDLFQDNLRWQTENIDELLERIERFRDEIDYDLQMIDELLRAESINFRRTCLRTLFPVGVRIAALSGRLTEIQAEILYLADAAISLFSAKESHRSGLSENNTYLFYARKNRMI